MKCYFILKEFTTPNDRDPPVRGYTFSYTPSARNKCTAKLAGDLYLFSGHARMERTDLGELPKDEGTLDLTFYGAKIKKIKAPESPIPTIDDDEMEA